MLALLWLEALVVLEAEQALYLPSVAPHAFKDG